MEDGCALFAGPTEQGSSKRGEETQRAGDVECFEDERVHGKFEVPESLRSGCGIKQVSQSGLNVLFPAPSTAKGFGEEG